MKDNIVFWGADEKDQKILVVLRLRANDNLIDIWTFPDKILKQDFIDHLFGDWQEIDITSFPEGYTHIERNVSNTELLPEDIKTDQTDLIKRAEKEWFVKVLSMRLFAMLKMEVDALHEQVMALKEYDQEYWDSSRGYWDRIITNTNERNLNREQAKELRELVNNSFERLKELKETTNKKWEEEAQANFFSMNKELEQIEKEIKDAPTQARKLFSRLKNLQTSVKEKRLSNSGRKQLWNKFNILFTEVKSKLAVSSVDRFDKRIKGLKDAINRMKSSIGRDKHEIEFQNKRAGSSRATQLEMQLRDAKIQMTQTRLSSKEEKLKDMEKLLSDLNKQKDKALKQSTPPKAKTIVKKTPKKASDNNIEVKDSSESESKPDQKAESNEKIGDNTLTETDGVKLEESKKPPAEKKSKTEEPKPVLKEIQVAENSDKSIKPEDIQKEDVKDSNSKAE